LLLGQVKHQIGLSGTLGHDEAVQLYYAPFALQGGGSDYLLLRFASTEHKTEAYTYI
jgi:hypothetical protein